MTPTSETRSAAVKPLAGSTLVDDATFDALNAIYLHKMATPAHVADVIELPQSEVELILSRSKPLRRCSI